MFEIREIENKIEWEKFVLNYPEANFLQSWNWGEVHKNLDKNVFRVGFFERKKLVGVMQAVVEQGKRATYLTVPGGPLIDWQNKDVVEQFKKETIKIGEKNNCAFVRVRPQLIENEFSKKVFAELGFGVAPMHLHVQLTTRLDLGRSEEELMARMRKGTRYEIKQALKLGIVVNEETTAEGVENFYQLQKETAKRQAFVPFGKEYFLEQFRIFSQDGQIKLYTAKLDDQVLAQAMVIFYGEEADYHYGASSEAGRKYPGAYLIQWEAIKEAKKRKIKFYDLWGIAPENEPNHRFAGVSLFKRGFGGEVVQYLPARDLVLNKLRYAADWAVEEMRRKVRGL